MCNRGLGKIFESECHGLSDRERCRHLLTLILRLRTRLTRDLHRVSEYQDFTLVISERKTTILISIETVFCWKYLFYILLFVVTILIVSDHPLVGFFWWCQKTHWSRGIVNSPHYRCWRNAFTTTITSCRHHLHSALMCHRSPELMAQDGMLNQRGHHYFRDPALYLEFYFQFNRIIWLSGQIMSHCKYFHCLTLTNCSAWVWQICSKMPPLHRIIHQRHLHFQIVSRRRDVNQVQNVSIIKQWPLNNYWD